MGMEERAKQNERTSDEGRKRGGRVDRDAKTTRAGKEGIGRREEEGYGQMILVKR